MTQLVESNTNLVIIRKERLQFSMFHTRKYQNILSSEIKNMSLFIELISLFLFRFRDIPSCIMIGIMGIVVDVPLYTIIALIKSPYMLFKGWQRLLQDVISGEGLFLETACIPIAGLAILFWPLVVIGSILTAIVSSIFVGLYGAVIVYQVRLGNLFQ
jgi:hypothetical protein